MTKEFKFPETRAEADKLIQEIGMLQMQGEMVELELNKKIKELKDETRRKIIPKQKAIERRLVELFFFYQKNWSELTHEGKVKIVNLPSGQIGFYLTPPEVQIKNKERVIKLLEVKNLSQFFRVMKEINKEAILMDPDQVADIPEIKIAQKEKFMVRPSQTKELVSETIKKLKKFLP